MSGARICVQAGCGRPYRSKGLCDLHYARKRRGVPLELPAPAHKSIEQRFSESVRQADSGCIEWTGYKQRGYGRFYLKWSGGKQIKVLAHRWAYERVHGPIPEGLVIDHLCRNRACVNPQHLEPVTSAVNTLRGEGPGALNALKTECSKGHPLSGDNLRFTEAGRHRICVTCRRASIKAYKSRIKQKRESSK